MLLTKDKQIVNLANATWSVNSQHLGRCLIYLAHKRCELLQDMGPHCDGLFSMWTEVEREVIRIARKAGQFKPPQAA